MKTIGYWTPTHTEPLFNPDLFQQAILNIRSPLHIIFDPQKRIIGLTTKGEVVSKLPENRTNAFPLVASLPAIYPEWLGDRSFQEIHKLRFPYVGGAMARGIASSQMVIELAQNAMLGFLGSAGLSIMELEKEIRIINEALSPSGLSWGSNLIHSPNDAELENKTIDLYLKYSVQRVSASAFMNITPAIVRYSSKGLTRNSKGQIRRRHFLFAKISRPEVARHFLSPAPDGMLEDLIASRMISPEEAELARQVPLSEDIIVESDSGGHTDNRPLNVLFPNIYQLKEELSAKHNYQRPIRIGAAGGLGTPNSIAAAFALGAAFVLIGSVHQSAMESRVSASVKELLAQADLADMEMTVSADMFEIGAKVQVLKRGTMMAGRANQLYQLYQHYESIEEIPANVRQGIEKNIFKMSLEEIWNETREYFSEIEPAQVTKADKDSKRKMALIFRWYLGNSSRWAIEGTPERRLDYQIWCGPAMGAFNSWVKGTFLEKPENRKIAQIALNMLEGAAVITRAHQLRTYGLPVPSGAFMYTPVPLQLNPSQ